MLQARPPQARTHLQTLLRVFEGLHLHAQPVCVTLPSTFAPNVTNAAPAPAFGTPDRPPTASSGPDPPVVVGCLGPDGPGFVHPAQLHAGDGVITVTRSRAR